MKRIHIGLLATVLGTVLLAGCERPSMTSSQSGYRGVAMGQVSNPRVVGPVEAAQPLPEPIAAIPSPPGSPLAKDSFKNVQVLGDLTANEFTRTMLAITAWVSPKEGCAYCHKAGDELSADTLYTKVVARKMIQMTRHINNDWKQHVAATGPGGAGGVTCYTCHRGAAVPANIWFTSPGARQAGGTTPDSGGQNHPSLLAGTTALGLDPLTPYLLGDVSLRSGGATALPTSVRPSIKQTEGTFGLMMHMSQQLGVNCTFCHNTRSHTQWDESPVQRTTAFHGIRMARELNNGYMLPLTTTFPKTRLGPTGDVAKIGCGTCHQGISKPLKGAPLLKDHPALGGSNAVLTAAADATAVPAAAVTAVATQPAALPARVLFEVGKDSLTAAAQQAIAAAADALKASPTLQVSLSGFADKTGNADKNMALSKQRALAVRDALKAAGVAESRIQLKKPEFVIGAASAESRRVDIAAVP